MTETFEFIPNSFLQLFNTSCFVGNGHRSSFTSTGNVYSSATAHRRKSPWSNRQSTYRHRRLLWIGHELVRILYSKNATVYSAGRNRDNALESIESIEGAYPNWNGRLHFLSLDLSDFSTVKESARDFLDKETRLDVLINNAGIMVPPKGSRDEQGHELQMGTNCLGPFLFTSFLTPILKETAVSSPPGTVRITWAASSAIEFSPKCGVEFNPDGAVKIHSDPQKDYCQSKAGNIFLAFETARRYGDDGIISVAWNPGNLQSGLYRHVGQFSKWIMDKTWLHPPVFGAYTILYAGWSDDITVESSVAYIIPWGRFGKLRADIKTGRLGAEEDGGSGVAGQFWEWCVRSTKSYAWH